MKTFLVSAFLIVLSSFVTPGLDLKYMFKVGDQYEYVQQTLQNSKQTFPGMGDVSMEASINGVMTMKVVTLLPSGSAKLEAFYTKLKMSTSSMMLNLSMDSEGPQEEDPNKIMKAMMNKTFSFTMDKSGRVEKVEGVDNLYSGLSSTGLDEDVINRTKLTLSQTLNDKSLQAILTNGFITYSGTKVNQGDSWTTESNLASTFPMQLQTTWTLAKIEGATANILSNSKMTGSDKDKVLTLPNGMKTKSDLNGSQSSSGTIDVKTGWPSEVKVKSELKGTMTILAGGFIPSDMIVPMETAINTTYLIRKK